MYQERDEHFIGFWRRPLVRQGRRHQLVVLFGERCHTAGEGKQPLAPSSRISAPNLMDYELIVVEVTLQEDQICAINSESVSARYLRLLLESCCDNFAEQRWT